MFTPVETSIGALLLHQGTTHYLQHDGKILGCSGILRTSMQQPQVAVESTAWPALLGIASSVPLMVLFAPSMLPVYPLWTLTTSSAMMTVALGAITGWGTKAGCGCTSGHMLIGLSRLSARSLVAVATFFPTALLTSALVWPSMLPSCGSVPCYYPSYPSASATVALVGLVFSTQLLNSIILPQWVYPKLSPSTGKKAVAFISGLQFGAGLLISGMASPLKVLRFFAFAFDWSRFDPSLALVILFGIGPNLVANQSLDTNKPPTFDKQWNLPERGLKNVDKRFLLGCVAFGVSWGISGVCPGPAILRAVLQPVWGALWLLGYCLGALG